jgi:transposase-like protein
MSCSDIRSQVKEIYGVNVSETTVSNITNRLSEHIRQWQDRALEPVYFILWMDGIQVRVRHNGKYTNKCIYVVIGLKKDGFKELLGLWIAESESAAFWMSVLTDLKARGVQDILIACTDNLAGFTQAIRGVFPQAITQICIVHQVRNSCKYVLWKDRKEFCADLRLIYTATNIETGEIFLEQMDQKWGPKYRHAIRPWHNYWDNLSQFFQFPLEIRSIMYTTNTIENMNRGIRKYTKTKVQFPDDQAALKAVYMAMMNIEKKWTHPIKNWGLIIYQFVTFFENRCKIDQTQFSGVYTK